MPITPSQLLVSSDVSGQIEALQTKINQLQVRVAKAPGSIFNVGLPSAIQSLQAQLAKLTDPSLSLTVSAPAPKGPTFASAETGKKIGADSLAGVNVNPLLIPGS